MRALEESVAPRRRRRTLPSPPHLHLPRHWGSHTGRASTKSSTGRMSGAASSKGKSAGTTPAAGAGAAREVIQDWADGEGGYTFERGRMEAAVRSICFDQPATFKPPAPAGAGAGASAGPAAKSATGSVKLNKDDVELITRDLLIPKHEAERALTQNEGNLTEALKSLLTPASP